MNVKSLFFSLIACTLIAPVIGNAGDSNVPHGFTSLFNGKDLTGWYGWSTKNPEELWKLSDEERANYKAESRKDIHQHWMVEGDEIVNDGFGLYLTSEYEFSDYELWIDYKTVPKADSGIYLKGVPQVQIWDFTDASEGAKKIGKHLGSGGLWNNSSGAKGKDPLVVADNKLGEWNTFRIRQIGARTSVWLNGKLVVDHATLENYFDRGRPLFHHGPIQLQTHGGEIRWRNIYVREIGVEEANEILCENSDMKGYQSVFNGKNLDGWAGAVQDYEVVDGAIRCKKGKGGTLYTQEEYGDFAARLEMKLPHAGNNGLAIRYPGSGNAAYDGMTELQVLDTGYPGQLAPYQYHGSVYGLVAAHRGYLRPTGEWNFQEVVVKGSTIQVELNGYMIINTDLGAIKDEALLKKHPGLTLTKGYFGFAGHNDPVMFRNVEIKTLD